MHHPTTRDSSVKAPTGRALLEGLDPLPVSLAREVSKLVSPRFFGGLLREARDLTVESARILAGTSATTPHPKDRRFVDPEWSSNPVYRRVAQLYVRMGEAARRIPDHADLDWTTTERLRFLLSSLVDAAAPTNTLLGNPRALRHAARTRGRSLLRGARNALQDLSEGRVLPSRSDPKAFRVGRDVAVSPGAVIHRTDMYELIQYSPATPAVRSRPVLIVPSYMSRSYVLDLTPQRSFVRYNVERGLTTFSLVWRHPSTEQAQRWGLDDYVASCLEAVDVISDVTGADAMSMVAICGAGTLVLSALGHMAHHGDRRVNAVTMLIATIDGWVEDPADLFQWRAIIQLAWHLRRRGVVPGRELTDIVRGLRPNAGIWATWVHRYLMGEPPTPDPQVFWSDDYQDIPVALYRDMLYVYNTNALLKPNALEVLGTPIDLSKIDADWYVVGAALDLGCPWKAVFRITEALGGDREFVLSPTAHVPTLLMGSRNPQAHTMVGGELDRGVDHWLATATARRGSWWSHWLEWTRQRAGTEVPTPTEPGNRDHPPLDAAPGRYVTETPERRSVLLQRLRSG